LEELADDLTNFKFAAFTPAFLGWLEKEIPKHMSLLSAPYDWDSLPGASEWASTARRTRTWIGKKTSLKSLV
jgi:hypothetical protein